ncbi:MAG TPA: hypothetical protein VLB27_05240 [candidate division Zixibacteria bacterium]|nr:hypothetical protein [candidate division Zixibacteria bacterium]
MNDNARAHRNIWDQIATLDRRYVYLAVAITVIIPLIWMVKFPIEITPEAQQLFDAVEALPNGSTVMLTFDYYASALPETEPASRAALRHLFRKDCKVVTMTTIPLGGPAISERVTRDIAEEYGKVYGVDFVNLGYKANYVAVLQGMGSSITTIYPTDNEGTPCSELPLMNQVKNYNDIDFIYVVSDNAIVDYWISIVNAQYHTPVGAAVTAVSAPKYYPMVLSRQMTGLLGGMKGAAEYEILVKHEGNAVKGMSVQSLVHFLIIFMVILGNVGFFMGRRKQSAEA